MRNTVLLIRKDFILVRGFILFFILFNLFMAFRHWESYRMYAAISALLLLIYSCSMDVQQHNNPRFLISLPVARREVVRAKYLALIPCLLFGLVCTLAMVLTTYLRGEQLISGYWPTVGLTLLLIPLFAAVYLPLHYWLGYKSNLFSVVLNVCVTLTIINGGDMLSELTLFFNKNPVWNQQAPLSAAVGGIAYLLLLYGSYLISQRLYNTKDL